MIIVTNKKDLMIKISIILLMAIFLLWFNIPRIIFSNSELGQYDNLSYNNNFEYYPNYNNFKKEVLDANGTHYIYIGKPSCPWCQQYVGLYDDIAKDYNRQIDYFNADTIKNVIETTNDDGSLSLKTDDRYQELVDFLSVYDPDMTMGYWSYRLVADSQGINHLLKWIYVPGLFKIVDGQVVDYVGTVEGHVKDESGILRDLTGDEINLFKDKLKDFFE